MTENVLFPKIVIITVMKHGGVVMFRKQETHVDVVLLNPAVNILVVTTTQGTAYTEVADKTVNICLMGAELLELADMVCLLSDMAVALLLRAPLLKLVHMEFSARY